MERTCRIEGGTPVRANRELAVLKTLFNKGAAWHLYEGKNPVCKVKFRNEPKVRLRWLDQDEEDRLLAQLSTLLQAPSRTSPSHPPLASHRPRDLHHRNANEATEQDERPRAGRFRLTKSFIFATCKPFGATHRLNLIPPVHGVSSNHSISAILYSAVQLTPVESADATQDRW